MKKPKFGWWSSNADTYPNGLKDTQQGIMMLASQFWHEDEMQKKDGLNMKRKETLRSTWGGVFREAKVGDSRGTWRKMTELLSRSPSKRQGILGEYGKEYKRTPSVNGVEQHAVNGHKNGKLRAESPSGMEMIQLQCLKCTRSHVQRIL